MKTQIHIEQFIYFLRVNQALKEFEAEIAPMTLQFGWEHFSFHPKTILDDGMMINYENSITAINWEDARRAWRETLVGIGG